MKTTFYLAVALLLMAQCKTPVKESSEYASVSRVNDGKAVSVMLTAYSTTLIADGNDQTALRVAVTDSLSREITSARDSVRVYLEGEGSLLLPDGRPVSLRTDTAGKTYAACRLEEGLCRLILKAGKTPGKIKVEARSGTLWPGSHEIHTLPAGFVMMTPSPEQLPATSVKFGRMIGADISWLPELEEKGGKFLEDGKEIDALALLKKHGFNYIRLRIFVNPENEKGYSPGKGFCGLSHTLAMAMRVKEAGMSLLLDFHYSDYWADPQQQYKPKAWSETGFEALTDSVGAYTIRVLNALKDQGTLPAMVQIGNEINHGILWPDGHIGNPDQLAALLRAGVEGVKSVDPSLPVMMHIALGGQNKEAVFWLDNMLARGVTFDLIGLSYYPRWHGTLDDLDANLNDLVQRYKKPVNVVEYSDFKKEVHDMVFGLPDQTGQGACIWEPLGWRSGLFEKDGKITKLMMVYDSINAAYLKENQ